MDFYSTANSPVIDDNTPQHGFFYDTHTGKFTLLTDPSLPNFVTIQLLGINDSDIAAGYWQDTAGDQHGLLYNFLTGAYSFFDDPSQAVNGGITITQITGINNADQLSGFYIGADGLSHEFEATLVPEPASLAIAGFGLLGLVVILRTKKW